MEEELDHILMDQYHIYKKLGKKMETARKLMGDDPLLMEFQALNKKKIQFFENMIENKQFLKKKKRKTKKKSDDFLARHPLIDIYKYAWMTTIYSCSMVMRSLKGFINLYKKDTNEKNDNKSK